MKKDVIRLILAAIILMLCLRVKAQPPTKHLPAKIKFELSDVQLQNLYAKIDSLTTIAAVHSDLPSNWVQQFNARVSLVLQPLNRQIQAQLVADTVVKTKGGKKP